MENHHCYMAQMGTKGPGSYMEPSAPVSCGYMITPTTPLHAKHHPYPEEHYYANGSPYQEIELPPNQQQQQQIQNSYGYSPYSHPRPAYQCNQHPPSATSSQHHRQPNHTKQQCNYPSSNDQGAPFRLRPSSDPAAKPVIVNSSPAPRQNQQQKAEVIMEQHCSSVQQQAPSSSSRPIAQHNNEYSSSVGSPTSSSSGSGSFMHTAMPSPSIDDMEPQNVSFIHTSAIVVLGTDETDLQLLHRLRNLNNNPAKRTNHITHEANSSNPHPALTKTFNTSPNLRSGGASSLSPTRHQQHYQRQYQQTGVVAKSSISNSSITDDAALDEEVKIAKVKKNVEANRGFTITFDDDADGPKREKPMLGAKRMQPSTKKMSSNTMAPVNNHRLVSHLPAHNATYVRAESRVAILPLTLFNFIDLKHIFFLQEGSQRRSLSSLAHENRDDYSPFLGDSQYSNIGYDSQEELPIAPIGSHRSYGSKDEEQGLPTASFVIGDELINPDLVF